MTAHVFDTSALVKHYHTEPGTGAVEELFARPVGRRVVPRLAGTELHSALAKLVRMGRMGTNDLRQLVRRYNADLRARRFELVRLLVSHHDTAERLIHRHGMTRNLRSLDALQLAVAIQEHSPVEPVTLVSTDLALNLVAEAEGLAVFNPDLA